MPSKEKNELRSLFKATTLTGMLGEYESNLERFFDETMEILRIDTTHKACFSKNDEAEAMKIAAHVCNPAPEFGRDAKVDPGDAETKRFGVKPKER